MHHPFTALTDEGLQEEPLNTRSRAYDLVLNGSELGSGSVRIHASEQQLAVLAALGYSEKQARASFGHLLDGLDIGAPPHAGIAIGIDRLIAKLAGHDTIRSTIAFPKDGSGRCLMTGSPRLVSDTQWAELDLEVAHDSIVE